MIKLIFILLLASKSFGATLSEEEFSKILNSKDTKMPLPKEFSLWNIMSNVAIKIKYELPEKTVEYLFTGEVKKVQGKYLVIKSLSRDNSISFNSIIYYDKETKLFILNKKYGDESIVSVKGKIRGKNKIVWIGRTDDSKLIGVETIKGKKVSVKETYLDDNDKILRKGYITLEYKTGKK